MTYSVNNPRHELLGLLLGFQKTYALITAASLRLADHVDAGADTLAKLSVASGVSPASLERLLRALANSGVFSLANNHRISMTSLGRLLISHEPGSLYWVAMLLRGPQGQIWARLEEAMAAHGVPFEAVFGRKMFDVLEDNPEEAGVFHHAMVGLYGKQSSAIARAYDFSSVKQLVDVGGGNGHLISAILSIYPEIQTTLFERRSALKAAAAGEGGPMKDTVLLEGDFFAALPYGADLYIMRHVLHDWDDEQCKVILSRCTSAMTDRSRLLVIESLIDCMGSHAVAVWDDLDMMLITGGCARSLSGYRALCQKTGLRVQRVIPTGDSSVAIIEIGKQ